MNSPRDVGYWRDMVAAGYEDLPTLNLTFAQAMRLWGIDEGTCRCVLDSFVESGYLVRTDTGQYCRADLGESIARTHRGAP